MAICSLANRGWKSNWTSSDGSCGKTVMVFRSEAWDGRRIERRMGRDVSEAWKQHEKKLPLIAEKPGTDGHIVCGQKKKKKRIQQDMNCEWKGFDDDESSQTKRGRNFGYSLTCTTNLNERLSESLSRRPKFDRALAVYLFFVRVILKLPASVWIVLLRNNKEASLAKCASTIVLHAVFAIWNGEYLNTKHGLTLSL